MLVTGSAGWIGRATVATLARAGWCVRGFDRVPTPGLADAMTGDLADFAAVQRAAAGAWALIHLAATPDEDDFLTRLLPANIVGVYHVLEAARQAGLQQVVLASTGQVVWRQELHGPHPVGIQAPFSPRGWYAITKIVAEMAGQIYARDFGMRVIAARLGWCPRDRHQLAELRATPRGHNAYLSARDAGRFFLRALEAALPPGFDVVYVSSRPVTEPTFDLEPARTLLGWEPQDRWPEGAADGLEAAP